MLRPAGIILRMPKRSPRPKATSKQRHFIKKWRLHRELTLAALAERTGISTGNLNRVENWKQDYNETFLELVADALSTTPSSLIMRDPTTPDAMWSIWEQAKPAERQQIEDMAKIVVRKRAS